MYPQHAGLSDVPDADLPLTKPKSKKSRPRTARRISERDARKLVLVREQLAFIQPGGSEERPIVVPTSAVVESRARSKPCPQCEGELEVVDHQREAGLRVVRVVCRQCHAPRRLWFQIVAEADELN